MAKSWVFPNKNYSRLIESSWHLFEPGFKFYEIKDQKIRNIVLNHQHPQIICRSIDEGFYSGLPLYLKHLANSGTECSLPSELIMIKKDLTEDQMELCMLFDFIGSFSLFSIRHPLSEMGPVLEFLMLNHNHALKSIFGTCTKQGLAKLFKCNKKTLFASHRKSIHFSSGLIPLEGIAVQKEKDKASDE